MKMTKETIVKEDGRLLTYYWFDGREDDRDECPKSDAESPDSSA